MGYEWEETAIGGCGSWDTLRGPHGLSAGWVILLRVYVRSWGRAGRLMELGVYKLQSGANLQRMCVNRGDRARVNLGVQAGWQGLLAAVARHGSDE